MKKHISFFKTSQALGIMCAVLFCFSAQQTKANNVVVSSVTSSGTAISFSIAWDNSWNTAVAPNNMDAVWIFVKYQDCAVAGSPWLHADLAASGHSAASPLQVDLPTDLKGAFLRRSTAGTGNIAATAITLNLNVGAGTYNFRVFAVEMVSIVQVDFHVGDGASASTFINNTITAAVQSAGLSAGALYSGSPAVPAAFPMGQGAFYCMKYEISQEGYAAFLSNITYDQQAAHTHSSFTPNQAVGTFVMSGTNAVTSRNGIVILTPGFFSSPSIPAVYGCNLTGSFTTINSTDDGQNIACNFLSWADLTAYLDWAALRPMTEMEYEKICRGPAARLGNEYPWQTIIINAANVVASCFSGAATNPGAANELSGLAGQPINGLCAVNCATGTGQGPFRCGFAASALTSQSTAGATQYGAMEMGGNVWERCVAVNTAGVVFTGTLGNGALAANGDADAANWPATTGAGAGFRGGSWADVVAAVRTSDRATVAATTAMTAVATRANTYGGRGVR